VGLLSHFHIESLAAETSRSTSREQLSAQLRFTSVGRRELTRWAASPRFCTPLCAAQTGRTCSNFDEEIQQSVANLSEDEAAAIDRMDTLHPGDRFAGKPACGPPDDSWFRSACLVDPAGVRLEACGEVTDRKTGVGRRKG
jgi:hypothetical protein